METKILAISDTHGQFIPDFDTTANILIHAGDGNSRSYSNYKEQFKDFKDTVERFYSQCYEAYENNNLNIEEIYFNFGNHETFMDDVNQLHNNNIFVRIKAFTYINEVKEKFQRIGINIIFPISSVKKEIKYKDEYKLWDVVYAETVVHESKFEDVGMVIMTPFTEPVNDPAIWGNHWSVRTANTFVDTTYHHQPKTFISHAPPLGFGDVLYRKNKRVGDDLIKFMMKETEPDLIICGHIHESHGHYYSEPTDTHIFNVSMLDQNYDMKNNFTKIIYKNKKIML